MSPVSWKLLVYLLSRNHASKRLCSVYDSMTAIRLCADTDRTPAVDSQA